MPSSKKKCNKPITNKRRQKWNAGNRPENWKMLKNFKNQNSKKFRKKHAWRLEWVNRDAASSNLLVLLVFAVAAVGVKSLSWSLGGNPQPCPWGLEESLHWLIPPYGSTVSRFHHYPFLLVQNTNNLILKTWFWKVKSENIKIKQKYVIWKLIKVN